MASHLHSYQEKRPRRGHEPLRRTKDVLPSSFRVAPNHFSGVLKQPNTARKKSARTDERFFGGGSVSGADQRHRMLRLVETDFAPTRKLDLGHRTPPCFLHF